MKNISTTASGCALETATVELTSPTLPLPDLTPGDQIGESPAKPIRVAAIAPAENETLVAPKKKAPAATSSGVSCRRPNEILALDFDPADRYLDNEMLSKGQTLTLLGPPGSRKSGFLLMLAGCTILKRDFFELKVNAKNLTWLVIQAENGNRRLATDLQQLKGWVGDTEWNAVHEHLVIKTLKKEGDDFCDLTDPEVVETLSQLVHEYQPDVVAFDPMAAFGGNLNHGQTMRNNRQSMAARQILRIRPTPRRYLLSQGRRHATVTPVERLV
ncbi:MAG: hypothetical protein QOD99_797 [Chthoniobacter sp.]|nr:hypothetical protein [Chthoniobacter sp.]